MRKETVDRVVSSTTTMQSGAIRHLASTLVLVNGRKVQGLCMHACMSSRVRSRVLCSTGGPARQILRAGGRVIVGNPSDSNPNWPSLPQKTETCRTGLESLKHSRYIDTSLTSFWCGAGCISTRSLPSWRISFMGLTSVLVESLSLLCVPQLLVEWDHIDLSSAPPQARSWE